MLFVSHFLFSEAFLDETVCQFCVLSLISQCSSLCCVVCVKLKRMMSIIAPCLPREGKNTRFVAFFVCFGVFVVVSFVARRFVILSLILSCAHHTCETFEHPTTKTQTCPILHVLSTREIMQAYQSSSITARSLCVLSAAKKHQMKKQRISTTVKAQEFIATDKAPAAAGPYSQGIKVRIKRLD